MNTPRPTERRPTTTARSAACALAFAMLILARPAPALTVHYHRPDADYAGWTLWTWDSAANRGGRSVEPARQNDYGLVFEFDAKQIPSQRIGLLPRKGNFERKDRWDRFWSPDLGPEIWLVSGLEPVFATQEAIPTRVLDARLVERNKIALRLFVPRGQPAPDPGGIRVVDPVGDRVLPHTTKPQPHAPHTTAFPLVLHLDEPVPWDEAPLLHITVPGLPEAAVDPGPLLDSPTLVPLVPMGAFAEDSTTGFRTWAPTASAVELLLYDAPSGSTPRTAPMARGERAVWSCTTPDAPPGSFYMFRVSRRTAHSTEVHEISDPWARCVVNSHGRGIVVGPTPPVQPGPRFDPADAVIYELHVRDMTVDPRSGVAAKGLYLGLAEHGTTLDGKGDIRTALDHITELGVNVVQIMPVHEFEGGEHGYNWGYKTSHFFAPERSYASGNDDISPVIELKELVRTLHQAGIKVVLDVVLNHTAESDPGIFLNFNGLAPHHFYRVRHDGTYWNGSGVGNEFRSETPMARRYFVDCLKYWVEEYGVDGFRFDLLGLTDLDTIRETVRTLRAIRPDVLLYGEPWGGGQSPIRITSKGDQRGAGFAVFNDDFRNVMRGNPFAAEEPGFVQGFGDLHAARNVIRGSIDTFTDAPTESINYLAAHDNRTFWDRLVSTTRNSLGVDDRERERMNRLGALVLLTSQGIPFLHAGIEMRRTKGGNDNSYNAGDDVNMIRWRRKAEHRELFDYYRGLIALRRTHPVFRLRTADEVRQRLRFLDELDLPLPGGCLGYRLDGKGTGDAWSKALVLLNPTPEVVVFHIPPGPWTVAVDDQHARDPAPAETARTITNTTLTIPRRSGTILFHR